MSRRSADLGDERWGEKIFKTGIKRDHELMYYIKAGDVWATPRKKPGQPKGKAQKVATAGIEMDYSKYLYYLDGDGDIARKRRQVGVGKRRPSRVRGDGEHDEEETESEEYDKGEEEEDEGEDDAALGAEKSSPDPAPPLSSWEPKFPDSASRASAPVIAGGMTVPELGLESLSSNSVPAPVAGLESLPSGLVPGSGPQTDSPPAPPFYITVEPPRRAPLAQTEELPERRPLIDEDSPRSPPVYSNVQSSVNAPSQTEEHPGTRDEKAPVDQLQGAVALSMEGSTITATGYIQDGVAPNTASDREEGRSGSGIRLTRDPAGETACLKADEYARALADVIVSAPGEFCFALLGHWGRGKTYLARLVGQKLPAQYDRIWFSAWKYRSRPELWAHLHESFYAEQMRAAWWRRVPRLFRANLHKHGLAPLVWMFIGAGIAAVPLGSLLQLAVVLLGAIGAIRGALLFFKQRTPVAATLRRFLAVNRHTEKLGLQAAIGVDLESLVVGWAGQLQWSGVRIFQSVAGYGVGVVALLGGLWLGFHPIPTPPIPRLDWLTWYPPPVVAWPVLAAVAALAVVSPLWLLFVGRDKSRLLLVVDDLDRIPSDEMLEIVESLKLFLENGTMRETVQLFLICEEEALRRALAEKYGRKIRTVEENVRVVEENLRAVEENLQKLFIAHLRLPPLGSSEQEEVLRTFVGAVADPALQVTDTATITAASSVPPPAATESESRARGATPPAQRATAADAPEYTDDDRRALLNGLRILGGINSTWAALGPRAIQSYVLRYKLARRLLEARGVRVLPERLAMLLAERMHAGSDGAPAGSEAMDAVIAEVA